MGGGATFNDNTVDLKVDGKLALLVGVDVNAGVSVDISPVVNVTNTIGHKTEDVAVVAYHETANTVVDTANQAGHAINNAGNDIKHGFGKFKKLF